MEKWPRFVILPSDSFFVSVIHRLYFLKSDKNIIGRFFRDPNAPSVEDLDAKLNKFVGAFFEPIYSSAKSVDVNRVCIDLTNHVCTCCTPNRDHKDPSASSSDGERPYTKQEILRDLFLWSIFMDRTDIAKVFLLHMPSRTCAALVASAIFKRYSSASQTVYLKEKYRIQSLEFESYAAKSIEICYQYNESLACELILRQIPLFGNVTCMQVSYSHVAHRKD